MQSYSCCSGGVMFVPEEIERKTNSSSRPVSYQSLLAEDKHVGETALEASPLLRGKVFGGVQKILALVKRQNVA